MRRYLAATLTGAALSVAFATSPAVAAPDARACHELPGGYSHGTVQAHHTVPHDNHEAHSSIPRVCSYPN